MPLKFAENSPTGNQDFCEYLISWVLLQFLLVPQTSCDCNDSRSEGGTSKIDAPRGMGEMLIVSGSTGTNPRKRKPVIKENTKRNLLSRVE